VLILETFAVLILEFCSANPWELAVLILGICSANPSNLQSCCVEECSQLKPSLLVLFPPPPSSPFCLINNGYSAAREEQGDQIGRFFGTMLGCRTKTYRTESFRTADCRMSFRKTFYSIDNVSLRPFITSTICNFGTLQKCSTKCMFDISTFNIFRFCKIRHSAVR
jgi:hypothetical protein